MFDDFTPGTTAGTNVFLVLGLGLIVAFIVFGVGYMRERDGGSKKVKLFAAIPMLLTAWATYPFFSYAMDPAVRTDNYTLAGGSRTAYVFSFPLSIVLLIAIPVGAFIMDRMAQRTEEHY